MGSQIIEGLQRPIAQKYITLYERLTHISGEISSLGKAIEVISAQSNSDESYLSYIGSIIEEKGDEITTLIDDFVSYPTIYLELKEDGK